MDLNKTFVVLIILAAFTGIACGDIANNNVSYGAETWITPSQVSVGMSGLTATITVKIKNNKDHVQYFKISHIYKGSLADNSTINWVIEWTDPQALKMVDAVSPELGGGAMVGKYSPVKQRQFLLKLMLLEKWEKFQLIYTT